MIKIGTSGWMYSHWRGVFYPGELSQDRMLSFYSQNFKTVEVNNTFYKLPNKKTVKKWRKATPERFEFAVKANRFIAHMKKLKEPQESLASMFDVFKEFGEKLGPILFQLPPGWHLDLERLKNFLRVLPQGKYAMEFRHKSWYCQSVYDLLSKENIAFCIHDHGDAPSPCDMVTADFSYLRFHGANGAYQEKYTRDQIKKWAERIDKLYKKNKLEAIYCYFNNDTMGFAIENAKELREFLDQK